MKDEQFVSSTVIRHLYEKDDELDCMDCLNQLMELFQEELNQSEINRIAVWFMKKYRRDVV